ETYPVQALDRGIRHALGYGSPNWSVPLWVLHVAALKLELIARILRLADFPGLRSYRMLSGNNIHSCESIYRELGYNPRATFYSTLPQILQHMEAQGKTH